MKRIYPIGCLLFVLLLSGFSPLPKEYPAAGKLSKSTVLVYTRNGKGYVHDNIPSAIACIQDLAKTYQFKVDVSDDPAVFTESNLKKYNFLVFPSTNNDVFDNDAQRVAFRRYIEAGGGLVGIHSITGTERNWKWFKMLVGCTFSWHAKFQRFKDVMIDPAHETMQGIPKVWEREDECYFGKELYPGTKVLMAHDIHSLNPDQAETIQKNAAPYADYYPSVWYQQFQGGNVWITTLGHSKESYQDPVFKKHILNGIRFIASKSKGINYTTSFSILKDDPLKP